MPSKLVPLLFLALSSASAQLPTHFSAGPNDGPSIAALRQRLQSGDPSAVETFWATVQRTGAPLIEPVWNQPDFSWVTFLWHGDNQTRNVVIFDGVADFDAKDQMEQLAHTGVWYKTYRVRNDARFAYNLSPNDSLQSINDVRGDAAMKARLAMWQVDPLNPHHCPTTFGAYGAESSYVELPNAPKLLWSPSSPGVAQGGVATATLHSDSLQEDKKLWIYTPPGFNNHGERYPLVVLFDGDRNVSWIPKVLDLLLSQRRIPPMVAVMTDDSTPSARRTELPCNPQFADFLAKELVPWARDQHYATLQPERTIVAGSSFGGLAAVFAALQHPNVFGNVIALSGSFWWKPDGSQQAEWLTNLVKESPKQPLRFYLEVGLLESQTMQIDTNRRMRDALRTKGYPVAYAEYDGGHAFLNWSNGMASGLQFLARQMKPPTPEPLP